jgi:signal transduction histidine kinase
MHKSGSLIDDQGTTNSGAQHDADEAVRSLRRNERQQRFLAEAGEALASSLNYQETLNTVAHLAAGTIAHFCVVEVIGEDGQLYQIASEDMDEHHCRELCATVASSRPHEAAPAIAAALAENKPIVVDLRADEDPHAFVAALRGMGASSVIVAPMVARGHALGVVILASRRVDRPYGEEDARMGMELARRAAMAVDNARLYERAERAIRARDEMLGIVAHDLRNPLNIVSLSAQLLTDVPDALPPIVGSTVERIGRATAQMERLIRDLLDVTRIEAGRMKFDLAPSRPADVLKQAAESLGPLAEGQSIRFEASADDGLPLIAADVTRLLQAIGNLVANAIKFTPRSGTIVLRAKAAQNCVVFTITDTGKGIAPENVAHLFDRFWQERPTDSRGVGLGLAIVKGIAEAHGGKVEAESTLGAGTSVSIHVPVFAA